MTLSALFQWLIIFTITKNNYTLYEIQNGEVATEYIWEYITYNKSIR